MLAELVDAVVGVDTHRDTHEAEIALPSGAPIRTRKINSTANDATIRIVESVSETLRSDSIDW